MYRAIVHASEVLTGAGNRKKDGRRVVEDDMGRIPDGAIVYSVKKKNGIEVPHQIEWVGATDSLPKKWRKIKKLDLKQKKALIPGLIDCHNHLIFAGDRSSEFAARCAGATYQEIAAQGGGINSTVRATREASQKELERLAVLRLKELDQHGVRTVEIKSGYGLSFETEMKILEIIPRLRKKFPQMTLTSTFLGAHAFPTGVQRGQYLNELIHEMLPAVAKAKLADTCDVFIDEGYFTLEEGRNILEIAKKLGMHVKVHADELGNTESGGMAADLGSLSADHLLKISDQSIQKLSRSNTVAVLLPGTAFYLKANYAPARKLIDAGAVVALATDFNPGTCMCLSPPVIMTLAALYLGMSRSEIFSAFTYAAAKALRLEMRKGTLEEGMDADFSILPYSRFEELYYRFASLY
jgi:imidazolonepropionase